MKPRILLVTSCRWFATARVAIAFAEAGCRVNIVSPGDHPVKDADVIHQWFPYRGLHPLSGLHRAIEESDPSLLVPCDDRATMDLLRLATGAKSTTVRQSILRAFGSTENFPVLLARSKFMDVARGAGVCTPETQVVRDLSDLEAWLSLHGFPAYLKADGTSGGVGVRVIHNIGQAEDAFDYLSTPPAAIRVVKRLLIDRDTSFVLPFVTRAKPIVNVQKLVSGVEANSAIACWQGELLGSIHARVVERRYATGYSTVIRVIENQEMEQAAAKLARRLNLSGLFGLDYMIERETGQPYLLEINPRATQTCHFALGPGRDPIGALAATMSGGLFKREALPTNQDTIALFPQEWLRDPSSPYLQNCYHDVPWSYPKLLRSSVKWRLQDQDSFSYRRWLQRLKPSKSN